MRLGVRSTVMSLSVCFRFPLWRVGVRSKFAGRHRWFLLRPCSYCLFSCNLPCIVTHQPIQELLFALEYGVPAMPGICYLSFKVGVLTYRSSCRYHCHGTDDQHRMSRGSTKVDKASMPRLQRGPKMSLLSWYMGSLGPPGITPS